MSVETGKAALASWLADIGLPLDDAQFARLDQFLVALRAAAEKTNLTADMDEDSWWRRHIADGLAAVAPLRARLPPAPTLLDLGAGAGFVGFAIKTAWPESSVALVETSYRKFQFLNAVAARLGARGLRVFWRRAGAPAPAERFDAVLARAVAPLPEAARLSLPLAKPGGLFVAWQSEPPRADSPILKAALSPSGATLEDALTYRLPGEARDRCLAIFRKGSQP